MPAGRPCPAQDGFHPGHEFPRAEWLDHIIIGSQRQAENPIGFLLSGREYDNRNVGNTAKLLTHLPAIALWKHEVQNHHRGAVRACLHQGVLSVVRLQRLESLPFQVQTNQRRGLFVIFDDQN